MRIGLILLIFWGTPLAGMAGPDDAFPEFPELAVFADADAALDQYRNADSRALYGTVLNRLSPTDTLARIYGLAKRAKAARRDNDLAAAWKDAGRAVGLSEVYFRRPHPVQAYVYHELGELASFYGRFPDAEAALNRALELRTALYGADHCMTSFTVRELGEFYFFFAKDYRRAEPLIREAFRIASVCLEGSSYLKSLAYYNLSCLYWRNGENEQAAGLARAALDILLHSDIVNRDFHPNVLNLLAIIARRTGDYDQAIAYSHQALEVRRTYRPGNTARIVSELHHLAMYYRLAGKYEPARRYLDEALNLLATRFVADRELYPLVLFEYADLAGVRGDSKTCFDYFGRGFTALTGLFGTCHQRTYFFRGELARHLAAFGQADSALSCYDFNIRCLRERAGDLTDSELYELADQHYYKAMLYDRLAADAPEPQGEEYRLQAIRSVIRADSTLRVLKSGMNWDASILTFAGEFRDMYDRAMEAAALSESGRGQHVAQVFDFMESNKSYLLFQSLQKNRELRREGLPDSTRLELLALEGEIQLLEMDTARENRVRNLARMETLQARLHTLRKAIREDDRDLQATAMAHAEVSLADCRRDMKPGDCLLQYYHGEDGYYLVAVTRDSTWFGDLGPLDSLQAFLQVLQAPPGNTAEYSAHADRYEALAFHLYQNLVPRGFCAGKDLVVVPDGLLYYLPFEALVTEVSERGRFRDLAYALHAHRIRYAYSATQYLRMDEVTATGSQGVFGLFPSSDLQAAEAEKRLLRRRFGRVAIAREDESREQVLRGMANRKIVHIASHGFANPEARHSNYLEFFNGEKLFDYELGSRLLNSRLVYLNACETNVGRQYTGEGVFSLSKAFMEAGCPAVISSLWKIPDASSAAIAGNFYRALKRGKPLDELFARARKDYLAQADERLSHPYFWAGLLLIGSDAPLPVHTGLLQHPIALGGLALLLAVLVIAGVSFLRRPGRYSPRRRAVR